MKKLITVIFLLGFLFVKGQTANELVTLAKAFHKYHAFEKIDPKTEKEITDINSEDLIFPKEYILEIIKHDNKILSDKFLRKPDYKNLKTLFIIVELNYNMFKNNPKSPEEIITQLTQSSLDTAELLSSYYRTTFALIVNKNRSIDLGKRNFVFDILDLKTDQEKGIFFLMAMTQMTTDSTDFPRDDSIQTYESLKSPLRHYPKFNGEPFYNFRNFEFQDFNISIDYRFPKVSFKLYYLKRYIGLLSYFLSEFLKGN